MVVELQQNPVGSFSCAKHCSNMDNFFFTEMEISPFADSLDSSMLSLPIRLLSKLSIGSKNAEEESLATVLQPAQFKGGCLLVIVLQKHCIRWKA